MIKAKSLSPWDSHMVLEENQGMCLKPQFHLKGMQSKVCNQSATEIAVDIVHSNYVQFGVCIPPPPCKKKKKNTVNWCTFHSGWLRNSRTSFCPL